MVLERRYRRLFQILGCLAVWGTAPVRANTLRIDAIGPAEDSSFATLLHVVFRNETFLPLDLLTLMRGSQLIADGKAIPWSAEVFSGPKGLPPQSEWNGCVALTDFNPPVVSGHHTLRLKLNDLTSNEITVQIPMVLTADQDQLGRYVQAGDLKKIIVKGLPRGCVEEWLPHKDGGVTQKDTSRYLLMPSVKVLVPYRSSSGNPMDDRVNGGIRIYKEEPIFD